MRISDAEWTVMQVAWNRAPVSVRDVWEDVRAETDWAYTTVKTILSRLVAKGALKMTKRGNTGWFEPRVTRTQARRSALKSLVDSAFEGAFGPLVQHLIAEEKLSKRDRRQLTEMLQELDAENEGPV